MNLRSTSILVASALALNILLACRQKFTPPPEKPVAVYVNSDLTLNDYVEPGQKLEWRVDGPHGPTFTFTPQGGLCDPATIHRNATFHQPAICVVAAQRYTSGQFNTYTYTLELDTAPGAPDPAPVKYTVRVGSCGPCP